MFSVQNPDTTNAVPSGHGQQVVIATAVQSPLVDYDAEEYEDYVEEEESSEQVRSNHPFS
jgi:hypothetical protein